MWNKFVWRLNKLFPTLAVEEMALNMSPEKMEQEAAWVILPASRKEKE